MFEVPPSCTTDAMPMEQPAAPCTVSVLRAASSFEVRDPGATVELFVSATTMATTEVLADTAVIYELRLTWIGVRLVQ